MYTYEERIKAVELYIKLGRRAAAVISELGYPSKMMLYLWYKEFMQNGDLSKGAKHRKVYTEEQKSTAVMYYLEYGRNVSRTIDAVGHSLDRETLESWIDEIAPGERRLIMKGSDMVPFTYSQKKEAILDYYNSEKSIYEIAKKHGCGVAQLYRWKNKLLGKEKVKSMKGKSPPLPEDSEAYLADLKARVAEEEALFAEIEKKRRLIQMEVDILEKTAEIIKKDPGIDPRKLDNKEKFCLIDALRKKHPLNDLLKRLDMAKSSYFYWKSAHLKQDKYVHLRKTVVEVFDENKSRYGYRRIHAVIRSWGEIVSEKVIRRLMAEEKLVVLQKKKRKYNSYKGELGAAAKNIVNRNFNASMPNEKWLTDLTEFDIPAGKVYLSPIIDCFDGMAVSWTIGTRPNAELVNTMLDDAIGSLSQGEHPIIHTDGGFHYRWPGWISRVENAGLTRSKSKKGCVGDNAACEGFFGRLKNEMFYERLWKGVSTKQFAIELDEYLRWYNEKRIKTSLGAMSPVEYRRSIGYAV
jgi:transposase InsO family protein/transposase-like protein